MLPLVVAGRVAIVEFLAHIKKSDSTTPEGDVYLKPTNDVNKPFSALELVR